MNAAAVWTMAARLMPTPTDPSPAWLPATRWCGCEKTICGPRTSRSPARPAQVDLPRGRQHDVGFEQTQPPEESAADTGLRNVEFRQGDVGALAGVAGGPQVRRRGRIPACRPTSTDERQIGRRNHSEHQSHTEGQEPDKRKLYSAMPAGHPRPRVRGGGGPAPGEQTTQTRGLHGGGLALQRELALVLAVGPEYARNAHALLVDFRSRRAVGRPGSFRAARAVSQHHH